MFKKIFILLITVTLLSSAQQCLARPNLQHASGETAEVALNSGYDVDDTKTINTFIGNLITIVLSIVGVLFLILMIYGGMLWMTAAGDEGKVTKAKNLITAAIIGVVITTSAYAISYFVISKVQQGSIVSVPTE